MSSPRITLKTGLLVGFLGAVVAVVALLPWWRNHAYLRDLYDYGAFMNITGRILEGQRPYREFVCALQTGSLILNRAAEAAGGGTYLGMTRGAAALIVAAGLGLTWLLARRFGPWVGALLALAIVAGSASQHTIIFYNPLGVLATALVVWSFAAAPLLSARTWSWHVLAAVGLFLGGINKINFHLLACLMAVGWIVWAWLDQRAPLARVLATLAFVAVVGFVLPIAFELQWTHVSWATWYYNIVQLPLSARGGRIDLLFSPKLYFTTIHDYYGPLHIVPVGAIGVAMPALAVVAALRRRSAAAQGWRLAVLVAAALLAALASSALLMTNNEIAYLTFSTALVFTIALWIGFDLAPRGGWFIAGVIVPAVLLAAAGWESAWRGQRSQFGHSVEPRAQYRDAGSAGPEFHYLAGLRLPGVLVDSFAEIAAWRSELRTADRDRLYYGPGLELLERVWPMRKVDGLPVVAAVFDGPKETATIRQKILSDDTYRHILVLEAWDYWRSTLREELETMSTKQRMHAAFVYSKHPRGILTTDPLNPTGIGGNLDGARVRSEDLQRYELWDHRRFLGVTQGKGSVLADTPANRMTGDYVLMRVPDAPDEPLTVRFAIDVQYGEALLPRWSQDVTLPAGAKELVVTTDQIDGSSQPVRFSVSVPAAAAGKVRAGWRGFRLLDTADRDERPPDLRSGGAINRSAHDAIKQALAPPVLQGQQMYASHAMPQPEGLLMYPTAEAWVRLPGIVTDIQVSIRRVAPGPQEFRAPRVIYYKGGRLEPFLPTIDREAGTAHFTAWTAELNGWLGILADPSPDSAPFYVRIESATQH